MSVEFRSARAGRAAPESATVGSLRLHNRSVVLKQIILAGQTTRAQIARECGLSAASAANLVADLLGEGLVHETGLLASRGGRPIALIGPRPDGAYVIGADVGERGVAVELFDLTMKPIDREFRGGREEERPDTLHTDLSAAVAALKERNPGPWSRLLGVGLGLPGIVETSMEGQQTLYAQSLGWGPVPIVDLLDLEVPVYAENGAKTQAKAELWFGAAQGIEHALIVLLGRGVGMGMVMDGRLQHGAMSSATEWGHTKIQRGGRRCRCGQLGCVEAYLGADAILAGWREQGGVFEGSGWRAIGQLLEAAQAGDEAARTVVDDVVGSLGASLGSMVNLTNPQRVLIGGWVGLRLMEQIPDRIDAAIRANSLERPGSQYELKVATFGGDTVALGAAIMPLELLVQEPRDESRH